MKSLKRLSLPTGKVKVLLVENHVYKTNEFMRALSSSNYQIVQVSNTAASLLQDVATFSPEVIIIDVDSPDKAMVDSLSEISIKTPKPIVMFSEEDDTKLINLLVKSGVTAYVAGGVNLNRIKSILDTSIARFEQYQSLRDELATTKQKLTNQRVVEQAKFWLIQTKKLSEKDAYHSMRKMAMDNGQKIEDVAKNIVALASL
jgi:response regulator NasT